MKIEDVRLDSINIEDERFRFSYHFDLTPLIHSISETGLIHPPIITHREGDTLIVTGWKRVLASQTLGLSSILCFIFEGQNDLDAFRLALEENLSFRPFTLLEKAQILHRLNQLGVPPSTVVKGHLSRLEIPQTLNHLEVYLHIAALDPETKKVIHSKNMGYPIVALLTEYSEADRHLLLPLLLPLGQNKQKELLQNLLEISKRDHIPVQNLLSTEVIQRITSNPNFTPIQKATEIRNHFQKQRYPTLAGWENSFQTEKKNLAWPDDIKIEPSPFFEGEEFTVRFTFKDFNEFKTKLAKLNDLASSTEISQLLKPPSPEINDE
jgi:hypothetical protein